MAAERWATLQDLAEALTECPQHVLILPPSDVPARGFDDREGGQPLAERGSKPDKRQELIELGVRSRSPSPNRSICLARVRGSELIYKTLHEVTVAT